MTDSGSEFSPNVFHPFYFIRNGLRKKIGSFAGSMTGKMMDFGCGTKPYKSLFHPEEYVGVDYYNEGHPHDNEQIDVFYDGKKIPLPDAYFDSVLSSEVFEHVFNLNEILQEINRVMKKDGRLLLTCPFVWNEHEVPNDYARYTRFALRDLLSKNGFEVIEISKTGNFITTIFQTWNLYFFHVLYPKVKKIFFLRWVYKFFIVSFLNLSGLLFNVILPKNDSLYLNTVILARKIDEV
jgi:SAM-dependent methyltransferase